MNLHSSPFAPCLQVPFLKNLQVISFFSVDLLSLIWDADELVFVVSSVRDGADGSSVGDGTGDCSVVMADSPPDSVTELLPFCVFSVSSVFTSAGSSVASVVLTFVAMCSTSHALQR